MSSVDDYENGKIKRHELTLPKKEMDRTNLVDVQGASAEPIFLAFRNNENLERMIEESTKSSDPYVQVTTDDDFVHTLWLVDPETSVKMSEAFNTIDHTYICDGHHRAAAAFNVGKRRLEAAKEAGLEVSGEEPFNYFMTLIFPSSQLKIMDYNRVLKSINGMTSADFIEKVSQYYQVSPLPEDSSKSPEQKGLTNLFIDNKWYQCMIRPEHLDSADPVNSLDTQMMSNYIFRDILGIANIRNDERVDFVGGIKGM